MAQVSYTPPYVATLANRAAFYGRIALLLQHFDALNINLVSIVRNGDNTVTITVDKAVQADQLEHLGLA